MAEIKLAPLRKMILKNTSSFYGDIVSIKISICELCLRKVRKDLYHVICVT